MTLLRRFEGAAHVPFACRGPPHLVSPGRVISEPTATMDLAATWLDLAGLGTNAAGMQGVTSRSLTGVLKGDLNRSRGYVSSGLKHWRMVVRRQCASCALLKYICCRGSNCQVGRAAISEKPSAWTEMLFDVSEGKDWREMKNLLRGDARAKWSVTAAEMRALLPPEFAAGCKNVQVIVDE